jgi:hypothetical protein
MTRHTSGRGVRRRRLCTVRQVTSTRVPGLGMYRFFLMPRERRNFFPESGRLPAERGKKLTEPLRSLPSRSEACRAVQKLTGPFRSLPGRSEACRAVQKLAGPFRSLPGRSEAYRAVQKLTGPFRSLPSRSEAYRAVQKLAEPFRSLPNRSEACRTVQKLAEPARDEEGSSPNLIYRGTSGKGGPRERGVNVAQEGRSLTLFLEPLLGFLRRPRGGQQLPVRLCRACPAVTLPRTTPPPTSSLDPGRKGCHPS